MIRTDMNRGRVRQADPIDVTNLDTQTTRQVPGGWLAEVVSPQGRVLVSDVRADWTGAMATCGYLLRMWAT
jgi:hypothetical protein